VHAGCVVWWPAAERGVRCELAGYDAYTKCQHRFIDNALRAPPCRTCFGAQHARACTVRCTWEGIAFMVPLMQHKCIQGLHQWCAWRDWRSVSSAVCARAWYSRSASPGTMHHGHTWHVTSAFVNPLPFEPPNPTYPVTTPYQKRVPSMMIKEAVAKPHGLRFSYRACMQCLAVLAPRCSLLHLKILMQHS
jgi:hypothetical protein